jgi:hypothetical protein
MSVSCEAAPKAELSAFYVPGSPSVEPRLYVRARGTLSDPCWTVAIHQSPLRIWPPQFLIEACHSGDVCPEVLTPYDVTRAFDVGEKPPTIVIHDATGPHEVNVDVVPDRGTAELAGTPSPEEAVGVSFGAVSLAEALADAADKLFAGQHPNVPRSVCAIEICYSTGGIAPPVLTVRAKKG